MRQLIDTVWQRRGTSWLWDDAAYQEVCKASEAWSLRRFLRAALPDQGWPEELPNDDKVLLVAGLDGSLDLLTPEQGETWLEETIKHAIFSFQNEYQSEGALIFWLPQGNRRLDVNAATDAVRWQCGPPHQGRRLDFGRPLWGKASDYPEEILLRKGGPRVGLYHARIT